MNRLPAMELRIRTRHTGIQPPEDIGAVLRDANRGVCIELANPRDMPVRIVEVQGSDGGLSLSHVKGSRTHRNDFRYDVADMASVFESTEFGLDGGIRCVVQRKDEGDKDVRETTHFNADHDDSEERELWQRVEGLPRELKENVFKYMDYDQVAWLADTDERFARSLASHRYGLSSAYDKTTYPDLGTVLFNVRNEAVGNMRVYANDGLWIAQFHFVSSDCLTAPRPGLCKRYPVVPGLYRWYKAAALTKVKFDEQKAFGTDVTSPTLSTCPECVRLLGAARESMCANQCNVVAGRSRLKVFALKGSEGVPLAPFELSPGQDGGPQDHDISVHVWTEQQDQRWLSSIRVYGGRMELIHLWYWRGYDTLIFSDPLKFFHVNKRVVLVDEDVAALVSDTDEQVVGYLLNGGKCTFRIPAVRDTAAVRFVGLNFLSSEFDREREHVSALLQHLHRHDVQRQLKISTLDVLYYGDLEREHVNDARMLAMVRQMKSTTQRRVRRLKRMLENRCGLRSNGIYRWWTDDNVLEMHETFEGDYALCSAYAFEHLGSSRRMRELKRSYKFVQRLCQFDTRFTLGVIDPITLRAAFSVALQENSVRTVDRQ